MEVDVSAIPTQLNSISAHVVWLAPYPPTDRPVLGAVSGEHGTLLVDAGNSAAHARLFLSEFARLGRAPARFLALTHWHWDHVFGADEIDLPTFAHPETRRKLAEMAHMDWRDAALDRRVKEGSEIAFCRDRMKMELPDRSRLVIRLPEIIVSSRVTLDLGGVSCQIEPVGGDHSPDSMIVSVPEDRVMFIGDCLGEDLYSGPPSYTTAKLFPLLDRLLSEDVDFYLEGHAPQPVSRQEMEEEASFLRKVGQTVDRLGPDRALVLETLPAMMDAPLDADTIEVADAFLSGLQKNSVPGRNV